ncbi:MAG: hypothetical protein K8E66_03385, partial [Phycisphaerales bacterium]|nr:hypothetical protein [Phycisphaerales bacterium]
MTHTTSRRSIAPRFRVALAVCTAVLLATGPAPTVPESTDSEDLVITTTRELAGRLDVRCFRIEEEGRVIATGDLTIIAIGEVRISGELVAQDATEATDAPDITILSGDLIRIDARVAGGKGGDGGEVDVPGGNGTSITLDAPRLMINAPVLSGNGGDGGPNADGGNAGGIFVFGDALTDDDNSDGVFRAGNGGRGGDAATNRESRGGNGGEGGDAVVHNFSYTSLPEQRAVRLAMTTDTDDLRGGWSITTAPHCTDGARGLPSIDAIAGDGGNGGNGSNAVSFGANGCHAALPGGNGGRGGRAQAGNGGPGQNGGRCVNGAATPGTRGGRGGA